MNLKLSCSFRKATVSQISTEINLNAFDIWSLSPASSGITFAKFLRKVTKITYQNKICFTKFVSKAKMASQRGDVFSDDVDVDAKQSDASSDAQLRPEDEFRRFLWTGSETSQVAKVLIFSTRTNASLKCQSK